MLRRRKVQGSIQNVRQHDLWAQILSKDASEQAIGYDQHWLGSGADHAKPFIGNSDGIRYAARDTTCPLDSGGNDFAAGVGNVRRLAVLSPIIITDFQEGCVVSEAGAHDSAVSCGIDWTYVESVGDEASVEEITRTLDGAEMRVRELLEQIEQLRENERALEISDGANLPITSQNDDDASSEDCVDEFVEEQEDDEFEEEDDDEFEEASEWLGSIPSSPETKHSSSGATLSMLALEAAKKKTPSQRLNTIR